MIGRNLKYIITVKPPKQDEWKYIIRLTTDKEFAYGKAAQEFGVFNVGRAMPLTEANIEYMKLRGIAPLENNQ